MNRQDRSPKQDDTSSTEAQVRRPAGSRAKHAGVGPKRQKGQEEGTIVREIASLGSTEAELMGLIWEVGQPVTSMQIAEQALYKRRAKGEDPISFATVTTTLRRLTDKGVLTSRKGETRTPYYTPTVGREEMAARILNNVAVTLLGSSLYSLIPSLAAGLGQGKQADQNSEQQQETIDRLVSALEKAANEPGSSVEETEG